MNTFHLPVPRENLGQTFGAIEQVDDGVLLLETDPKWQVVNKNERRSGRLGRQGRFEEIERLALKGNLPLCRESYRTTRAEVRGIASVEHSR